MCRFDGEAMVHAVCFEDGKAKSYGNHWLRTFRYGVEKAAGCNIFLRVRAPDPSRRHHAAVQRCRGLPVRARACNAQLRILRDSRAS